MPFATESLVAFLVRAALMSMTLPTPPSGGCEKATRSTAERPFRGSHVRCRTSSKV